MGCFQVFEDHEGNGGGPAPPAAVLGGRLEARSAGSAARPAGGLPPPLSRGPIAAACRTALLPGIRPPAGAGAPGSQRRQLWCRPPQHPHYLQPDRDRLWMALQRELVTVQGGRWWSGRSSPGGSLPASHPRRLLGSGREPFCCWGPPGTALSSLPIKIPPSA